MYNTVYTSNRGLREKTYFVCDYTISMYGKVPLKDSILFKRGDEIFSLAKKEVYTSDLDYTFVNVRYVNLDKISFSLKEIDDEI